MPPKVLQRAGRDQRQLRLGAGGLEPSTALRARIDASLAAGASFVRADTTYTLGETGLTMLKNGQLSDLGRYAIRKVEQRGDLAAFQDRSSEITVNLPSLLARKDRYNQWVLVRPEFVTFSSDDLHVDPEGYAAATSVRRAADARHERSCRGVS